MMLFSKPIVLEFYKLPSGNDPVRDWLKGLDGLERRLIGLDLMRVQWQYPIGMPLCKALG